MFHTLKATLRRMVLNLILDQVIDDLSAEVTPQELAGLLAERFGVPVTVILPEEPAPEPTEPAPEA